MAICPKCYEKMRDCTCLLTAEVEVEAEARRSATDCSRAWVQRSGPRQYFGGPRKGTPEPESECVWTDRPWECAPLSVEFAEWLINVPLRDVPGIRAVICPANV